MAQIFISHSARDISPMHFINQAFATPNVEAKYKGIEAIPEGRRTAPRISADIARSNAVFVLLGENVERLQHTQDWVAWESGVSSHANKDIWVFEAFEDRAKPSVIIPHLHHHVCFEYTDPWLAYIRAIVSAYDDSRVLPAVSAEITGGVATENPVAGLFIGGITWLLLRGNRQGPPPRIPISCVNCNSTYRIHRDPLWNVMRCSVCNAQLRLQFPDPSL